MNENYQIKWVGLLEIRDKKILMVREKGNCLLQLPGGGQDQNETDLETLHREIMEELEVNVKNPQPYTEFILPGRHEEVNIKFVIYTADIPKNFGYGEDIEEVVWVDSKYKEKGQDIGNPTRLVLIQKLKDEGKIN